LQSETESSGEHFSNYLLGDYEKASRQRLCKIQQAKKYRERKRAKERDHEMNRGSLRLGMSGTAAAFAANAGVRGLLASILVWVSAYATYLWPAPNLGRRCHRTAAQAQTAYYTAGARKVSR
jgi:hypothetical protein